MHIGQENNAEVYRVDAVTDRNRQYDRHDDDQCRENIEHHAQNQQEQVEQYQEGQLFIDMLLHEFEHAGRNLGIDHVVGRGQRHANNDQDPADQHHRLAHDFG